MDREIEMEIKRLLLKTRFYQPLNEISHTFGYKTYSFNGNESSVQSLFQPRTNDAHNGPAL